VATDGLEARGCTLVPLLRQEKLDGLAGLVYGTIEVTPTPTYPDVGILLANAWDWS
jgi:hypothetical protein